MSSTVRSKTTLAERSQRKLVCSSTPCSSVSRISVDVDLKYATGSISALPASVRRTTNVLLTEVLYRRHLLVHPIFRVHVKHFSVSGTNRSRRKCLLHSTHLRAPANTDVFI